MTRPAWFRQYYPWLPIRCPNGHPVLPGTGQINWMSCRCGAADLTAKQVGHRYATCTTDVDGRLCLASMYPPEHVDFLRA